MSDISIPGVTASKYKTDELIKGLMKAERVPRDRADADLTSYKKQQSAWRDVNQLSTKLRDSARSLFSYDNPFSEKNATSTNERAVTATVSREALDQTFRVAISQIAQADSFLSAEIPANGQVAAGTYDFSVGDSKISVSWKGGSFRQFVDALNRRSNGILRASLVKVTDSTQAVLIESLKTGAKERLQFGGDALAFAVQNGIIKKNDSTAVTTDKTSATVAPSSTDAITFSQTARASKGLTLEYEVTVDQKTADEPNTAPEAGPDTGDPGGISYGGISVSNASPEIAMPTITPPVKSEPITDNNALSLRSSKGVAIPLPAIPDGAGRTTVSVPLAEYGDVNSLVINNRNTDRTVTVENVRLFDPKAAGEYAPVNPVSVAQDAVIKYEGITITRPTNDIEDLVPGVTINLHEPTDKTETISVKPDTEPAKEAIIAMVANYNRVLAEINILTQNKPEIIDEIEYFTPDEKKAEQEKLGMMFGDTTLSGIKASLQRIASNAYTPGDQGKLTMLSQLGISTKSSAGSALESSRMRGYLEIDEKKLDEALKGGIKDVKALFGYDTDGDLIIDAGVGKSLDGAITPYVQTGGIFALRTSGLDTKITATQKKIAQLDTQLADKESELKAKYGQMEGTLNSLQNQSNSISNFSKQNSN